MYRKLGDGGDAATTKQPVSELAAAHWSYVKSTLLAHGIPAEDLVTAEHHYLSAFAHGYKHAVEDCAA